MKLLLLALLPLIASAQAPAPPTNLRSENVPLWSVPRPPPSMKVGMVTGMSISPGGYPSKLYVGGWTVPQAQAVLLIVEGQGFGVPVKITDPPVAGTFQWIIPDRFQDGKVHYITGQVIGGDGFIIGPLDTAFKFQIPP